jgi:ABC-type multidrug transport system ATPase subunit
MPLLSANSIKIQRGKNVILNNSDFALESGKFYHLLGASGSGKTTLLWTLARLHPLVTGTLRFKGEIEIPINRWRAEIALSPQKPVLMMSSGTVQENLLYPLQSFQIQKQRLNERQESLPTKKQLETILYSLGLDDIPLERQASSLSGGQEARLVLIRLLLTKPTIILADEPTAGLDKDAATLVLKCLQQFCKNGGTVIFSSHTHNFDNAVPMELDGNGGLLIKI